MAVIRNYGAQGGVIAALEDRLPVGMGGFPPCEPRGFAAPRFYTLKSVDEATGVVTETPVLQCPTAADLAKLPEGRTVLVQILHSSDKDEWNQFGQKFAKKDVETVAASTSYTPTEEEAEQGYIVLPNDAVWMMARWVTQGADGNDIYGDWGLNEVGVVDASPMYGVGRPLVTMAHDDAVAHVVSPCGTVWLDGVDTKQDEIWLAADKKKHSVTSKVGWAAKPVTVKEDGTVWINTVQFFSESLAAEVDFTSYSGTYDDAKAFADADEAAMASDMMRALDDGYHIIDVNPNTDMTQGDMTIKSILLDAGGQSTTSALAWDSDINGGLYRQRIAVGDGVDLNYQGAVGCLCGNLDSCSIDNSVIHYAICGDVGNDFSANSATIESVTCGDVSGAISAASATIDSVSCGNVDGEFYADNATIESVSCGYVGNGFYANSATIESVTCGDVSGAISADSATIDSVSCGDVDGNFSANYATIESVSCGDVGGNFSANYATIESVSCGDVYGFYADSATIGSVSCGDVGNDFSANYATIESVSCGDVGGFNANSATIESVTCGDVSGAISAASATIDSVSCGNVDGEFYADNATIDSVSCGNVYNFSAASATIDSVSCGNVGNLFSANSATIESVTCGDCSVFLYIPEPDVTVKLIKVGTLSDGAAITNATVEEVIIGKATSGYDFTGSNFGKLTVTSTTVMTQTTPPNSVDEILVPAPLVSMYKANSLFSADFADKIKAM